jgi:hypothetical protein
MKLNLLNKSVVKSIKLLFATTALVGLVSLQGCGGNGAGANGTGPTTSSNTSTAAVSDPISVKVAGIDVLSSQPALDSDGRTAANITVVVKDAGNRALEGATVDIATAPDSQTILEIASTKSAADGTVRATLRSTGKTNRNIVLTATVGALKKTLTIPVSGTSITVNGPTAIANNGSGKFTVSLRDSGGAAISDAAVTVSSRLGNEVAPATLRTDPNGQASFNLNITKAGSDSVTVSASGASNAVNVTVAPASLAFTNVSVNDEVLVSTQKLVVIKLTDTSGVNARSLSVTTTRGSTIPANGVLTTNGSGEASFVVESANAGPTTINVTGPSGTAVTTTIEFVSRVPFGLSLQPSKSLIAANPIGSKGNSSLLTATVKDAAGNPVKGVKVNFRAQIDPSSGLVDPPSATTDSAGNATVAFISGPNASGSNGVTVAAAIDQQPSIGNTAVMTVTNGEVSIRIGTANLLVIENDIRYKFQWTAVVVDSSGNPVSGAPVSVQVVPVAYRKGFWVKPTTGSNLGWQIASPFVECPSEDGINSILELDGLLQPLEDLNRNGKLDPGGVATVEFVSGAVTGPDGFADFNIKWPKNYSVFTKVRIDVKTQVKGTEATVSQEFTLPILDADAGLASPPAIFLNSVYQGPFGSAVVDETVNGVVLSPCRNPR